MNHAASSSDTPNRMPPRAVAAMRESKRLQLEVAVDLASDHNFFTGFSYNVSEGGLFVATHSLLPVGTRLEIAFALPGDDTPIRAVAEVRWVREHCETSDLPPGMGLRFLELDERSSQRVTFFVCGSRAPFFFDDE